MIVPLTPIRCLNRAVELYGNKTGVVCGECRFTYREFAERCERVAAGLLAENAKPGDRVAYLSFNNHQLLEGYFAVPLIRAIVMPLNVRLNAQELVDILNHSGARVLIFENDFVRLVEAFQSACPNIERYVSLGPRIPPAQLSYDDLLQNGRID